MGLSAAQRLIVLNSVRPTNFLSNYTTTYHTCKISLRFAQMGLPDGSSLRFAQKSFQIEVLYICKSSLRFAQMCPRNWFFLYHAKKFLALRANEFSNESSDYLQIFLALRANKFSNRSSDYFLNFLALRANISLTEVLKRSIL